MKCNEIKKVRYEVVLTNTEKEAFEKVIDILEELSNIDDLVLETEYQDEPMTDYELDEIKCGLYDFFNLECVHIE